MRCFLTPTPRGRTAHVRPTPATHSLPTHTPLSNPARAARVGPLIARGETQPRAAAGPQHHAPCTVHRAPCTEHHALSLSSPSPLPLTAARRKRSTAVGPSPLLSRRRVASGVGSVALTRSAATSARTARASEGRSRGSASRSCTCKHAHVGLQPGCVGRSLPARRRGRCTANIVLVQVWVHRREQRVVAQVEQRERLQCKVGSR